MTKAISKLIFMLALLSLPVCSAQAQHPSADPVERVIHDVVGYTLQRAADELLRVARIDPEYQGYSRQVVVYHAPARLDTKQRKQLERLVQQHQRRLAVLEHELDRELAHLARDYKGSHQKARPAKQAKERDKFQRKVDRAYDKFAYKVDDEHERFDRQRDKLLRDLYSYQPRGRD